MDKGAQKMTYTSSFLLEYLDTPTLHAPPFKKKKSASKNKIQTFSTFKQTNVYDRKLAPFYKKHNCASKKTKKTSTTFKKTNVHMNRKQKLALGW